MRIHLMNITYQGNRSSYEYVSLEFLLLHFSESKLKKHLWLCRISKINLIKIQKLTNKLTIINRILIILDNL